MNRHRSALLRPLALLLAVLTLSVTPAQAALSPAPLQSALQTAAPGALPGIEQPQQPDGMLPAEAPDSSEPEPPEDTDLSGTQLTFHTRGGRSFQGQVTVARDGSFTFPEGETLAQFGSYFRGWAGEDMQTEPQYAPGDCGSVLDGTDYYAVFVPVIDHAVTYRLDDSSRLEIVRTGKTCRKAPTADAAGRPVCFWTDETGARVDLSEMRIFNDCTLTAVFAPALTEQHVCYMSGYENGSFRPNGTLTRAEAAQLVFRLLADPEAAAESDVPAPRDVSDGDWFAEAVTTLIAAGLMDAGDGLARPNDAVTRAEFVTMLARLFPMTDEACSFPDVPEEHPFYAGVAAAQANGWITGYEDGSFHPDAALTRAEAARLTNRALNREADAASVKKILLPVFSDVSAQHWAYNDVMEAAVQHTTAEDSEHEVWTSNAAAERRFAPGPLFVGSALYYIGADGRPVSNTTVGTLAFGPDGRYTSGNAEMDGYITAILDQITTPDMTQEEKLRAAYLYTRDSFTYLRRNYYQIGQTGWSMDDGLTMLRTRRGNCYCYAAVFYYLSRQLGYDSRIISGVVGTARSPHGWVEIDLDGVTNIFDTELEMAYRAKGKLYYDFYRMPYARTPWQYIK